MSATKKRTIRAAAARMRPQPLDAVGDETTGRPRDARRVGQAERILAATYRVLTRHGFSALSMGKIATEAKVNKRMLHYYFDTKERLIQEMTRSLGAMLLAQVEDAISGEDDPERLMGAGFDVTWKVIVENRELLAAYFSLASEAVYDERLRATMRETKDGFRALITREIDRLAESGKYEFKVEAAVGTEMIVATVQGFAIEFIERGETPELRRALDAFKAMIPTFLEKKPA